MKKTLVLILLLLSQLALADDYLQIHFEVTQDSDQPYPLLVTLGGTWLEMETLDRRVRHNFQTRKSLVATKEAVEEFSLYSDIGFRVAELQNRIQISEALNKAGVESPGQASDLVKFENLFGLEAANAPAPQWKETEDTWQLHTGDQPLMEISKTGERLSPEQATQLARFVRYYSGGHPDGLKKLIETEKIPSALTLTQRPVAEERKLVFRLAGKETIHEVPEFPKKTPPQSRLDKLVAEADSLSIKEIADRHILVEQQALEHLEKKEFLKATLKFLEATLNTGQPISEDFEANREDILGESRVSVLLKALKPREKSKVDASIKILESLKEEAGKSAHVLTVFQGSLLLGADQSEQAREKLFEALEEYPAISSAWKDLGESYYQEYLTAEAWKCWDTGRTLSPENSHYKNIERLEKLLVVTYPEFF